jgi:antitoxin (DNA-binding transcriptional repressor) of toxin-antitoxin stability system
VRKAKIAELKNQLSRYLALVRRGEVVQVLDRDVPIAHIVPIREAREGEPAGAEMLVEMERKGLVRRGRGSIPRSILERDPDGRPVGALAALLDERSRR